MASYVPEISLTMSDRIAIVRCYDFIKLRTERIGFETTVFTKRTDNFEPAPL